MSLLNSDVEEHSLRTVIHILKVLPGVYFQINLGAQTSKHRDLSDYLYELAYEIINQISPTAIQVFT